MGKYKILIKGVVRHADKYLVVKKWYDDRIAEPYQWEFIDGALEFGEKPEHAVIRHIAEQTGLSATIGQILYTWTFFTGDIFHIGISYLCMTALDNVILSEDLISHEWIRRDEFERYIPAKVLADIEKAEL
ncbi:MAG: hydrolase [Herbinix sp.]|jgi:8-oxo-dGTP pyrophosphatase MutT (NUDIX family)|nr:hydrolase [Herbinix sp.]